MQSTIFLWAQPCMRSGVVFLDRWWGCQNLLHEVCVKAMHLVSIKMSLLFQNYEFMLIICHIATYSRVCFRRKHPFCTDGNHSTLQRSNAHGRPCRKAGCSDIPLWWRAALCRRGSSSCSSYFHQQRLPMNHCGSLRIIVPTARPVVYSAVHKKVA